MATMEHNYIKDRLKKTCAAKVIVPEPADRQIISDIIYNELCLGEILDASRKAYQEIIARLVQAGAQGIILGCTEIPLLIGDGDVDVPLFDTTALHAAAAVEFALGD